MKSFKSCTASLSSEWKSVSEHFGVSRFAHLCIRHKNQRTFSESEKGTEPDRESWKKAHELYLGAFKAPKAPDEQKRLTRILKRPIPESIQSMLFEYDAFLHGLGRMSLSQCAPLISPSIFPRDQTTVPRS